MEDPSHKSLLGIFQLLGAKLMLQTDPLTRQLRLFWTISILNILFNKRQTMTGTRSFIILAPEPFKKQQQLLLFHALYEQILSVIQPLAHLILATTQEVGAVLTVPGTEVINKYLLNESPHCFLDQKCNTEKYFRACPTHHAAGEGLIGMRTQAAQLCHCPQDPASTASASPPHSTASPQGSSTDFST